MVAVKQREEACLSAGGTLDTTETEIGTSTLKVAQVPKELLDPESGALTDSGKLGRLKVGEAQSGQVAVLLGKMRQARDDGGELWQEKAKPLAEEDEVGIATVSLVHATTHSVT
jgi:hypothetical protein